MSRSRWLIKKAARQGVHLGGRLVGPLRPHGGVRALTYHRFGATQRDAFCVEAHAFDRQMAQLAASGVAVSVEQLLAYLAGLETLPDGSVLVTIDDGCTSVFTTALPILVRHKIPAAVFVNPGLVEDQGHALTGGESLMTVGQLRELADHGLTVGSHSWTHRSLAGLVAAELREELVRSRDRLEQWLGRPVLSFAYPYGTWADFNTTTAAAIEEAGYACAFTSQHGAMLPGTDPWSLPRVKVEGGESLRLFRGLTHGTMDGWRIIDRNLWRLQSRGRA